MFGWTAGKPYLSHSDWRLYKFSTCTSRSTHCAVLLIISVCLIYWSDYELNWVMRTDKPEELNTMESLIVKTQHTLAHLFKFQVVLEKFLVFLYVPWHPGCFTLEQETIDRAVGLALSSSNVADKTKSQVVAAWSNSWWNLITFHQSHAPLQRLNSMKTIRRCRRLLSWCYNRSRLGSMTVYYIYRTDQRQQTAVITCWEKLMSSRPGHGFSRKGLGTCLSNSRKWLWSNIC